MSEDSKIKTENAQGDEAQAAPGEQGTIRQPMTFVMGIATTLLVSIGMTVIGLLSYHQFFSRPPQRIATVDINEVMQIKQVQLTALATRPGATDRDREAAYDQISIFGREIENAIVDMQRDCACVLVVRAAVLKGQQADLTAELKKRMGMDDVSLEKAIDSLASAGKFPSAMTDPVRSRK